MTEPVPDGASFDPYLCPQCEKVLLRYNSGTSRPVQVTGGDSSLTSIIAWEHNCVSNTNEKKLEDSVYLTSQKAEVIAQKSLYQTDTFHSTAQFKQQPVKVKEI